MSQVAHPFRTTFAEFCDMQLPGDTRYELIDGQVIAMNQPSLRHGVLTASLAHVLRTVLDGRCFVSGPVGVYCVATDEGFGPDLVVFCDEPRFDDIRGRALVNPRAIFEILSPTTERVDKRAKLRRYRTLESLQEYVLIAQDEKYIEIYRRAREGWIWQDVTSGTFEICGASVSIDAIYDRIDLVPRVS